MTGSPHRRWGVFWGCLILVLAALYVVNAQNMVGLDAYVSYSILDNGGAPLADGSVVYIIGSSVNTIPAITPIGGVGTNYIADQTTANETFLATVYVNSTLLGSNGTFWTYLTYDSTTVQYVYLRYFDIQSEPVTGYLWWGNSGIFTLSPTPTLGVNSVDFTPGGPISVTSQSNFVVIPEPSTVNLFLLVVGMSGAMWAGMKKEKKDKPG